MFDIEEFFLYENTGKDHKEYEEAFFYALEDAKDTFFIQEEIYSKVVAVLSTKQGQDKFQRIIGAYIDRNTHKLNTPGPQYLIPFTESDKEHYFQLFDTSPDEIKKVVVKVINNINANADWKLLKNNPVFVLFFCVIRYFTVTNNKTGLNGALAALALSMYPSIFTKYYKFEPNPAVMQYTIDNLTNKFNIKKAKHIFGNLMMSIQQSWTTHEKNIKIGTDVHVVAFILRIRNDQNSFMRKIRNEFEYSHQNNLTVHTVSDSFEDNAVVDVENDTNRVEGVTNKITLAIMINGIDLRLAEASAKGSHVSIIDTRNYLNKIVAERNSDDIKSFIESILFLFLYENKKSLNHINSRDFLEFSLSLYKKTNSKDSNIANIKRLLDKWGDLTGLHEATSRKATLVDYKRAFFTYFIFAIQKHN